jgi:hypothetical protein
MASHVDHGAVVAAHFGITRSPKWPAVERAHLVTQPHCVCCAPGAEPRAGLQVHHVFPFHYCIALGRPDLELDQRNLITLCEDEPARPGQDHHLIVGHLDDFQSSNLAVVEDATRTFHAMAGAAIRADARWKEKEAARLTPLDQMTDAQKKTFRAQMDARFPRKSASSAP